MRLCRRSALLLLLGLAVNSAAPQTVWSAHGLRLPGVLQRFAVCSLVIGGLQLPGLRAADQLPSVSTDALSRKYAMSRCKMSQIQQQRIPDCLLHLC